MKPPSIALLLCAVRRRVHGAAESYLSTLRLSLPEYLVLSALRESGPLSPTAAASCGALDLPAASRAITTLFMNGMIKVERSSLDRRNRILSLSRRGRALANQAAPRMKRILAEVEDAFSPDDRKRLAAGLQILLHSDRNPANDDRAVAGHGGDVT